MKDTSGAPGFWFLPFAAACAALSFWLAMQTASSGNSAVELVAPIVGVVSSAAAVFLGHISYPRVQNLKIYLAGYLTGLTSLLFLLPDMLARYAPGGSGSLPTHYQAVLFALAAADIVMVALVPSFVTYRATRLITLGAAAAKTVAVALYWAFRDQDGFLDSVVPGSLISPAGAISVVVVALIVTVHLLPPRNGFYTDGIGAGYTLIAATGWFGAVIAQSGIVTADSFGRMLFSVLPFYLSLSIVLHWFSRMEHRASYDPLLQIYNRGYCNLILSERSDVNTRPPFAVAMVDIDHFKQVNDTYGHQAGDEVLHNVAQLVRRYVVPGGIACRYGGEELAIFFPETTGAEAARIMRGVREAVEMLPVTHAGTRIGVTVSVGVSVREQGPQSLADVVSAADRALYLCKQRGRNQVRMTRLREKQA